MKIFVFDFDNTITSEHTHNIIADAIHLELALRAVSTVEHDPEAQWNLVKNVMPIRPASEWSELFTQIIKAGHHIAIASHNDFGKNIILRYLKEVLNLPEEMLGNIIIESWLPNQQQQNVGKNIHIENLLKSFTHEIPEVILVDDDLSILLAAQEAGYQGILATADGAHLKLASEAAITSKHRGVSSAMEYESRHASPKIYIVDGIPKDMEYLAFANSIMITSSNKLVDISPEGHIKELEVDPDMLQAFLATMNLTVKDIGEQKLPYDITSKITSETISAYRRLVMPELPDSSSAEPPQEVMESEAAPDSDCLNLSVRYGEKEIHQSKIRPGTSFREILQTLEGQQKIGPSTRNRSCFFMNTKDINTADNLDKPLQTIVEKVYEGASVPSKITIEIKRR